MGEAEFVFFPFFFSERASRSARNLSRNACHTSLVESNGATGGGDVSSFCYARGVISFFHREPPRESRHGEEGTSSIGSKICKHSFRLAQTIARLETLMRFDRRFISLSLSLPSLLSFFSNRVFPSWHLKREKKEREKSRTSHRNLSYFFKPRHDTLTRLNSRRVFFKNIFEQL